VEDTGVDDTRAIGRLPVSLSGLGCNNFGRRIDEERSAAVVAAALDAGVTVFDTADVYGDGRSEEFLGRGLGRRRDEVVIVTKFGSRSSGGLTGGDPAWVARACDESLFRLGTDRIDVYLQHQPDPATPIHDTLEALGALQAEGKVLEIGCSNVTAAQVEDAVGAAAQLGITGFVTVQNEYSLLDREPEAEVLPACGRLGMSFMPYFPLAAGLLTGKYRRGQPAPGGTRLANPASAREWLSDARFDLVERLETYGEDRGRTLLELALSWLAARPEVATVIAGATTPEQVRENTAILESWALSADELDEIDALTAAT
jgi:aryl-alcohol dehydrogenase-like predicted oxidoreductase